MTSPEQQDSAPDTADGTDVDAAELDVSQGAAGDVPATNDPEQFTEDSTLGGTHGENAGGAG